MQLRRLTWSLLQDPDYADLLATKTITSGIANENIDYTATTVAAMLLLWCKMESIKEQGLSPESVLNYNKSRFNEMRFLNMYYLSQ